MRFQLLLALIVPAALAACVGPPADRAAAPATPRPVPPPVAAPPPAPVALSSDWRDWPRTPGDWRYVRDARGSSARYGMGGAAYLTLRCEGGTIALVRAATSDAVTVRTSALTRAVALSPGEGGGVARLAATDPLLDAMGFSRGRFTVESAGTQPLVVPAWSEILRVVEDCRR